MTTPLVGIVMGSHSDWSVMENAAHILERFAIPFETRVVSAHRTPDMMFEYAETARARGLTCIIAGAGGSAHLPGMLASKTTLLESDVDRICDTLKSILHSAKR